MTLYQIDIRESVVRQLKENNCVVVSTDDCCRIDTSGPTDKELASIGCMKTVPNFMSCVSLVVIFRLLKLRQETAEDIKAEKKIMSI
ncbi:hypothetical protein TNCT_273231 [Trichonephila clavata]|uniref:Uncharacterized protein n=1 Tax=Trichonephila clavata TaxID=2740835 RepID=A0A8X6FC13_TRICU|nr:hypothetical protein TNCT_273231 [Trichonephila clavata]